MPSGLSFGSAVDDILVFYRIKVLTIQIRSLSQKALTWFLSCFWGAAALSDRAPHVPLQSWSYQQNCCVSEGDSTETYLHSCYLQYIYMSTYKCIHVYPLSALQVEKDGNCSWESDTTTLALCCDTVCLHITFLPFFRKKKHVMAI